MSCNVCVLGTHVRLCDFHKEQAWNRWLTASRNGVDAAERENVLNVLRNVSQANSRQSYETAVTFLKQCHFWKSNALLRNWFGRKWLPHYKVELSLLSQLRKILCRNIWTM